MKNISYCAIVLLFLLSGCRYEEGPFLNFTKVEKRIRGVWNISNVYKNGEETTTEFPTFVESQWAQFKFYKSGTLLITYLQNNVSMESSGSWTFVDKKRTLRLIFKNQYATLSRDYEIVKFKTHELKLLFTDDKDVKWTLVLALQYSFVPYDL
jgi:hypothetical protein